MAIRTCLKQKYRDKTKRTSLTLQINLIDPNSNENQVWICEVDDQHEKKQSDSIFRKEESNRSETKKQKV